MTRLLSQSPGQRLFHRLWVGEDLQLREAEILFSYIAAHCTHQDWGNHISDLTPPEFITLLFTDIGIFTPSAVSEELIKFFKKDFGDTLYSR